MNCFLSVESCIAALERSVHVLARQGWSKRGESRAHEMASFARSEKVAATIASAPSSFAACTIKQLSRCDCESCFESVG